MNIIDIAKELGAIKTVDVFASPHEDENLIYFDINQLKQYTEKVIDICAESCLKIKEQDWCVDVREGADVIKALKVDINTTSSK